MLKRTNYLTKIYDIKDGWTLPVYEREAHGYQTARKVLTSMKPEDAVAPS